MTQYIKPITITSAVVVGAPLVISMDRTAPPITVTALPGAGGTLLVESSTSPNAIDAVAGLPAAQWIPWTAGAAAANTTDVVQGRVLALRFTAAGANGRIEVLA